MLGMQRPAGSAEDELRTAMQALWEDARPRVLERIATLEDAVAAVLAGGLIAFLNRDYIGWFAYAPLSNTPFTVNGAALITQGTQIGLAVAVVGLLLLAFWAGHRIGMRTGAKNR